MRPRSTGVALALLAAVLAAPATSHAAPCAPANSPGLTLTDPAGGGALYATHELELYPVPNNGDNSITESSVSAPGARRVDNGHPERRGTPTLIRDTAGPLAVSAEIFTADCEARASTTAQLLAPKAPLVSVKKPKRVRLGDGSRAYPGVPRFTITLKHRVGSDRRPVTVRAKVSRKRKLPKKGAKTQLFGQRSSDVKSDDSRCLICPRRGLRGFPKTAEVRASDIETQSFQPKGLKVELIPPAGHPVRLRNGRERFAKPSFGADIELLQGGQRVGRLRIAGRCVGGGQSTKCRFKTFKTR